MTDNPHTKENFRAALAELCSQYAHLGNRDLVETLTGLADHLGEPQKPHAAAGGQFHSEVRRSEAEDKRAKK